jgi:DNA sulfur modification protein DndB
LSTSPLDRFKSVLENVGSDGFKGLVSLRERQFSDEKRIRKQDIDAYQDVIKGYEKHKELQRLLVYRKIKTHDKLLEDRVWLLLRKMGAGILNKPNSTLVLNEAGKTKQIDVIGKVENTVFFVECKSSAELSSRSLRKDLSETHEYKRDIVKLSRALWGDSVRVCFAYALNNISLSPSDVNDAEQYDIKLWDSVLLSYFEDLVDRLGNAAKYQVFAETFEDEEIDNYSPRVPAIKGRSAGSDFYYFLARPSDLLKIAYIYHRTLKRRDHYENPYQRMVNKKRIEDIREFIKKGRNFANDIILNFKRTPTFQNLASVEGIQYGVLTLPAYYKSAWIVDGQHRLFGYTDTVEASNDLIPVFAFQGLSEEKQGELFVDINENQKSVEPNLLWDLYSDMYFESSDEKKKLLCTISLIGKELNLNKDSPLYGHVYIPSINERQPATNITLQTICNRLEKGIFIKRKKGNGDLFKGSWDGTVSFASKRLIEYFEIVKSANEDDWNRGEEGFARSNVGINTFLLVFQEILKEFRTFDKNPVESDERFDEELRHLLGPIAKMLKSLDKAEITKYKQNLGEKGFAENAKKVCRVIRTEISSFSPEILREGELAEVENEASIPNPSQMLDQVELKLRELIHSSLLNKFGPSYWDSEGVIPQDVKDGVKEKITDELTKHPYRTWEDYESGEKKIQFCDVMDYTKILISKNNWPVFEHTFRSKETLDEKIKKLNEFRKRDKHSRSDEQIDGIVQREGEAAILWFSRILGLES